MKKNMIVHLRCTEVQKIKIDEKAKRADMTTSSYVLKAALNSKSKIIGSNKDMARCLAQLQVGMNLVRGELQKMGMCGLVDENLKKQIHVVLNEIDHLQEGADELWRLSK